MVGEYRIEVSNRYSKYFLNIRRNITVLQGNSATGKTELIRMLSQYEDQGESSGIQVVSAVPLHVLRGRNWKRDLQYIHGSIVFLDESQQYARSREFAESAQKSDNYYVIVNRDPLPQLSYAISEIYAFREASASQKYHEAYRVYNEMVPLYNMDINRKIQPSIVITEDTNSGFQFFQAMYRKDCIAAGGKSRSKFCRRRCEMLKIYFGEYDGTGYIPDPDMYFDNQHADEWMEEALTKRMVKDIDRSEIVGPHLIESPFLGPIPPERLSGGVKTLIMIDHDEQHVYNASACGNNCAKWLLEICKTKDRIVRLGYIMDFGEDPFSVQIANTGKIVHSMAEFMDELIDHDLV